MPEAKAAPRKHNKVAIVVCVMYRLNTDAQACTTASKGRVNKHRLLKKTLMKIKEFETEIIDVIPRTSDVKSFRFSVPRNTDIDFKPGQFFVVTIKIKGQEATKHFSFSISPTEKGHIEFTKKITESDFSLALNRLTKGDWARLKMPFGFFTFEGEHEKVAFLTGGIGITCIKSMCKFATDKRLPTDMILLYSNRTENDIVFRDDLASMQAENKKLKVFHTLTSPDIDKNYWKGETGRIDSKMVKEKIPDYKERVFYICGPPKMVEVLKTILSEELKVQKEKIKWEHFTGY